MRSMCLLFAACAALLLIALPGCQSGPAAECDDCAVAEASAPAPFAQAAAASASGGQKASNQPTMSDPGSPDVSTTINRGSGANTSTQSSADSRSQAGAPSVNQGLVIPNEASAATGGGVSPVVASLQLLIDSENARLEKELDPDERKEIRATIAAYVQAMAQAQASAKGTVNNTYNFDGARIVQSVANGSNSGDGQTAIDPKTAEAVAKPLAETAKATMEAGAAKPDPSGADLAPTAPDAPDLPPAGPAGNPNAGE